jgi:hypothetical protein
MGSNFFPTYRKGFLLFLCIQLSFRQVIGGSNPVNTDYFTAGERSLIFNKPDNLGNIFTISGWYNNHGPHIKRFCRKNRMKGLM